jgi:hypothetical protein
MIYVDPLFHYVGRNARVKRVGERHGHMWSHMWADKGELEALHALAAKIGMRREWFQDKPNLPHYDLVPPRREHALRLGAVEMPLADWLRKQKEGA